jgi:hypothetical protein
MRRIHGGRPCSLSLSGGRGVKAQRFRNCGTNGLRGWRWRWGFVRLMMELVRLLLEARGECIQPPSIFTSRAERSAVAVFIVAMLLSWLTSLWYAFYMHVRIMWCHASQRSHFDLCSPGQASLFTHPSQRQLWSVCTVITSLYNTLHHKQEDRLQRHILHHSNNCSRNKWL